MFTGLHRGTDRLGAAELHCVTPVALMARLRKESQKLAFGGTGNLGKTMSLLLTSLTGGFSFLAQYTLHTIRLQLMAMITISVGMLFLL